MAGVAGMLVASGEFSPSVSSRLAPRTHDRPSDPAEIIDVVYRPLRGPPGQHLMTYARAAVIIGAVNTLGIAPKLRQNP